MRIAAAPEVIASVGEGAQFDGYGMPHPPPGFTALFYQEDCVYVPSDAVELLTAPE